MAQKVNVSFVDDLDGSEAEGTVVFGVDGKQYEIDLSEKNAAKLRELFAPFVGAGRKVGGGPRTPRTSAATGRTSREDTKAIREWALAQGMDISARGRISSDVLAAYEARDEKPAVTEPTVVEPVATEPVATEPVVEDAPVRKTRSRAKAPQPEFSAAK